MTLDEIITALPWQEMGRSDAQRNGIDPDL